MILSPVCQLVMSVFKSLLPCWPPKANSNQAVWKNMQTSDWPPAYTLKRHWRARHVKMSYTRANGLEITVPTRFSKKHLPAIIEENKDWIIKQKSLHDQVAPVTRPTDISFAAFQQTWSVHYFQHDKRPRVKPFAANGIILSGDIEELSVCLDKLSAWVRQQAKILLTTYFRELALQMNMPYLDVTVRSQSTLWGSCSQDKSIRLNYKLVFLPEPLMRHIMIHELCHTRHMNHSEKFWQLVARYDENWMQHRKAMKRADDMIPAWIK